MVCMFYKPDSLCFRLCRYVKLEIGSDSAQTVSLIYKATRKTVVTQFRLLLEHLLFFSPGQAQYNFTYLQFI